MGHGRDAALRSGVVLGRVMSLAEPMVGTGIYRNSSEELTAYGQPRQGSIRVFRSSQDTPHVMNLREDWPGNLPTRSSEGDSGPRWQRRSGTPQAGRYLRRASHTAQIGYRDGAFTQAQQGVVILRVATAHEVVRRPAECVQRGGKPGGFCHSGGQHHDRAFINRDLQIEARSRITSTMGLSCGCQVATMTRPVDRGETPRAWRAWTNASGGDVLSNLVRWLAGW